MKSYYVLILAAMLLALPACDQNQSADEKVMDNVNDALDRRSDEKYRDAGEDVSDAVDDAFEQRPGEKALDAGEDTGDEIEDTSDDIGEDLKDATK